MNCYDINKTNANKIYKWCKNKFGKAKNKKKYPTLVFHKEKGIFKGEYDFDELKIHVWGPSHNSFSDFVKTIIHEYVHYKQKAHMYFRYHIIHKKSYNQHPYEKRANDLSNKYYKQCIIDIYKK